MTVMIYEAVFAQLLRLISQGAGQFHQSIVVKIAENQCEALALSEVGGREIDLMFVLAGLAVGDGFGMAAHQLELEWLYDA